MKILIIFISIILSIFSTVVMSYIAMSTPIGPWIETTLVLCSMLIFKIFMFNKLFEQYNKSIGLTVVAGSIGGILATAFGFSVPTLYFIDYQTFNLYMSQPMQFSFFLGTLAFAPGILGLFIAYVFQERLIIKQQLPFAIGELVYKMISAQDQIKKAIQLALGFITTNFFLLIQFCFSFMPKSITLLNKSNIVFFEIPEISILLDIFPMFWAVGYVTGHVIGLPLIIGLAVKIFCIGPLFNIYYFLHKLFLNSIDDLAYLNINDFILAFCSGIVLYSALIGFLSFGKFLNSAKKMFNSENNKYFAKNLELFNIILIFFIVLFNIFFLSYFNFSFVSQAYLLLFTFICTYQLLIIAGKIGIAPLGRFATFVMVPGMFLFGFNPIQITIVSTFVEVAGGISCDALFAYKMAHLANINKKTIMKFQLLGLIISTLVIGIVFWIFIYNFGLGSSLGSLPVTKAASRALLINVKNFDLIALFIGFVFGYLLEFLKGNSMLILGGILMPPNLSIMLIAGGLTTFLMKDKEKHYPFWSGVFAANSLWMLIKTFLPRLCSYIY